MCDGGTTGWEKVNNVLILQQPSLYILRPMCLGEWLVHQTVTRCSETGHNIELKEQKRAAYNPIRYETYIQFLFSFLQELAATRGPQFLAPSVLGLAELCPWGKYPPIEIEKG